MSKLTELVCSIVFNPEDLDSLSVHGTEGDKVNLVRNSLYVKFDPLVSGRQSLAPILAQQLLEWVQGSHELPINFCLIVSCMLATCNFIYFNPAISPLLAANSVVPALFMLTCSPVNLALKKAEPKGNWNINWTWIFWCARFIFTTY